MTPREKIQKSPRLKEIASMLNSPMLEECCEAALLTFADNLPMAQDSLSAAGYHYQLIGARRFLHTLKNLTNVSPEPTVAPQAQFRHDV